MMLRNPREAVLPEIQQPLLTPASPPEAEPAPTEKLIAIGENREAFFCNRRGESREYGAICFAKFNEAIFHYENNTRVALVFEFFRVFEESEASAIKKFRSLFSGEGVLEACSDLVKSEFGRIADLLPADSEVRAARLYQDIAAAFLLEEETPAVNDKKKNRPKKKEKKTAS